MIAARLSREGRGAADENTQTSFIFAARLRARCESTRSPVRSPRSVRTVARSPVNSVARIHAFPRGRDRTRRRPSPARCGPTASPPRPIARQRAPTAPRRRARPCAFDPPSRLARGAASIRSIRATSSRPLAVSARPGRAPVTRAPRRAHAKTRGSLAWRPRAYTVLKGASAPDRPKQQRAPG